jgi:DNA (cytosine-5)-methyltransferase 1
MENVKGLLSAKVNGEKVFDWIKRDLQNPGSVFKGLDSHNYRIYSLSTPSEDNDNNEHPKYKNDRNFLIQAEKYGVPQKRHRLILLGIREDFKNVPGILAPQKNEISLKDVIGDLPKLRSGLGRTFKGYKSINGKIKRSYKKETDSDENWADTINEFKNEIISWNGFAKDYADTKITPPPYGIGAEFIEYKTPSVHNPLADWYKDSQGFMGACNHITRTHLIQDLKRYLFSSIFADINNRFPRLAEFDKHSKNLLPDHKSAKTGKFADRFRVQMMDQPATTITSHISKDGHYFIHYDPMQCRSLTVREAARVQTFPDNYLFCGSRTAQYHQVGNAVPPYLAFQISNIVKKIFL